VKDGQFLTLPIVIGLGGLGHQQQPRIWSGKYRNYKRPPEPTATNLGNPNP
jgi:hypothetical protein